MECLQKFITSQQGGFYHLLHENLQGGWKNGQKFITANREDIFHLLHTWKYLGRVEKWSEIVYQCSKKWRLWYQLTNLFWFLPISNAKCLSFSVFVRKWGITKIVSEIRFLKKGVTKPCSLLMVWFEKPLATSCCVSIVIATQNTEQRNSKKYI